MADAAPPAPAPAATPVPASDIPVHPANRKAAERATDGKFMPAGVHGQVPAAPPPTPAATPEPAPAAPPPPAEDPIAVRLAAAAKKERLAAQTISELQKRLKDLESKAAAPVADPLADLRKQPLSVVAKALGVTNKEAYDILTQQALSADPDSPPTPAELRAIQAEKAIEELRAELKKRDEDALEEARKVTAAEERRVIDNFRRECAESLAANKDTFELAANFATGDDVFNLIDEHWKRQVRMRDEGRLAPSQMRVLQIAEALQMLEDHFDKQVTAGLKLSKVRAKVQPAPVEVRPQTSERPSVQPRAITSSMSPTTPAAPPASASGVLSREERLARATAAFEANRTK